MQPLKIMPERTPDEIGSEIEALKACKNYIPRTTVFGEHNHHTLDLQIEELRDGIDDTDDEWNDYTEREQDFILEARYWKEGDEDESPSSGWDNYKPTKPLQPNHP